MEHEPGLPDDFNSLEVELLSNELKYIKQSLKSLEKKIQHLKKNKLKKAKPVEPIASKSWF